ncbi:3-dehydroquinate synthase [Tepidibacter formicigenes]|jgi:3-dehydroquinate synthase|uniref:3-dehydroquinate synthase n=1 Tax=Tepidibacter formicigenes DSM 15518 TaxID=1123349 RepID=A0A1M6P567_9FIRM|nr:3-dehydroquinate synthase [Tepidibacter formicigenes]SHK03105.1 3-dehydroquinate synthase [Tepidibacter formicigenes DSM 15518]
MEKGDKVYIERDFKKFNLIKEYDKILVITDKNVKKLYVNNFIKSLKYDNTLVYDISSGEESKCLSVYEDIFKFCIENGLSRKSLIISLGGGVVGDLSGFVASTYMRGIDLVHCPTTLLSQVDSSIGGKTGINLGIYKNIIGSFYQPEFIYININTLKTLQKDEFLSGLSEVIKYGLIYDYDFLDYIIENKEKILDLDEDSLIYIVNKSSSIKLDIVKKDEKESNLRKILNLGHSFGHGIEKLGKFSHGYAVSIGTHMAFRLALKKKLINKDYYDKVIKIYKEYNLPMTFKNINSKYILDIMKKDKKNSYLKFSLVLPVGCGKVDIIEDTKEEEILSVIEEVRNEF